MYCPVCLCTWCFTECDCTVSSLLVFGVFFVVARAQWSHLWGASFAQPLSYQDPPKSPKSPRSPREKQGRQKKTGSQKETVTGGETGRKEETGGRRETGAGGEQSEPCLAVTDTSPKENQEGGVIFKLGFVRLCRHIHKLIGISQMYCDWRKENKKSAW